jgi:hypothetical protein
MIPMAPGAYAAPNSTDHAGGKLKGATWIFLKANRAGYRALNNKRGLLSEPQIVS